MNDAKDDGNVSPRDAESLNVSKHLKTSKTPDFKVFSSDVPPRRTSFDLEAPSIVVGEDDFADADPAIRVALELDADRLGTSSRCKMEKRRKIFGVFPVPRRWKRLSTAQILGRYATSRLNLGTATSAFFHLILALILASIALNVRVGTFGDPTTVGFSPEPGELELIDELGDALDVQTTFETVPDVRELPELDADVANQTIENLENRAVADVLAETDGSAPTSIADVGESAPSDAGGGVPFYRDRGATTGRRPENRRRGLPGREGDVDDKSEDAVERGLAWLARHQLPDGGWSFDLTEKDANGRVGACEGRCSNSVATSGGTTYRTGLHPSRTAATAVALLPFLGAGYVHSEPNKYQQTVARGLKFLTYRAKTTENGVDFREGFVGQGAYIQALVVLTLCEAFEMTNDEQLRPLVEGGLNLIEVSQLDDGGWRYYSRGDFEFHSTVSGDTSVLGWQIMALKSGVSAGFEIRPSVAYRAGAFLDLVASRDGRSYRYQPETKEAVAQTWGTTAVGALVREYLGWGPGTQRLDVCAEQLGKWIDANDSVWQKVKKGASGSRSKTFFKDDRLVHNLYFSYYAALALHHYGGSVWKTRFSKLRNFLVETQSRGIASGNLNGCEDGSWLFYDRYMNDGGRLLNTSLAVLILETPYRYLPMYR